jgi:D-glycerate 3-kinase
MNPTSPWPSSSPLDSKLLEQIVAAKCPALDHLPPAWLAQFDIAWGPIAAWLAQSKIQSNSIPIVGVHGGQGSGKSTLSKALAALYRQAFGWNTAIVSIDDLYLSHADRLQLAKDVHPLLATRGVPGTHDWKMGIQLFESLRHLGSGEQQTIPHFDKASDDRLPEQAWHQIDGPVDMILFEGWCVGAQACDSTSLTSPVNELEANEDPDGIWRHWVNNHLDQAYRQWFGLIDTLIMLKVPDMSAVLNWRGQQEQENQKNAQSSVDRGLDEAGLKRFIQHYQRITEHSLEHLPNQADLVVELNRSHAVDRISVKANAQEAQ